MVAITGEQFGKMNIMAGTARSLERSTLSSEDKTVWDRDFDLLVQDLKKLVDLELGTDLEAEKGWYTAAVEVAKGYFNDKPFGGLKSATGQFGFRLLGPQDLKTDAAGGTPKFYSWLQKVTTTSVKTYADIVSDAAYARNASEKKSVIAFHRLVSYKPSPKLVALRFNINDYPYVPYTLEMFSQVQRDAKLIKIVPMPARVLLHPGGKFHLRGFFDLGTGASAPVGTTDIDVEIAPFGMIFAEYDYLAETELI